MVYIACAVAFLGVLGGLASLRARKEVPAAGRVSGTTFAIMFAAFVGAGICAVLAARAGNWPLPLSMTTARVAGVLVGLSGLGLIVASRMLFTFRRAWGLDFDKLVTGGVYRWSRNPQVVGWFLMYMGIALYGRSGAALVIACLFLIAFVPWILAEERVLQGRFGEVYTQYRQRTPRFLLM
jgi:protein-S-isoprenylcysteine O-methyltransferase Ste14